MAETVRQSARAKQPTLGRVQSLQGILDRCRVDDETGCWLWARAANAPHGRITPMVMFHPNPQPGRKTNNMPAARAAWLLSGREVQPGHYVWRNCLSDLCVNPAHCQAGTKAEMFGAISASGRNRGKPERRAVCERNRRHMLTPPEVVRRAEAMFSAGALQKEVRAALRMSGDTARSIRLQQHPHSTGRQHVVRGASVFTFGAAA